MVDTPVVSNTLQKTFRDNFPSQINSGRDLHVSDVIIPTVDFTTTVTTSGISQKLQESQSYGNITSFLVENTTSTISSDTGFIRIFGNINLQASSAGDRSASISITDGSTPKKLLDLELDAVNAQAIATLPFDFIVFCRSGDSITATSTDRGRVQGTTRQIADINGTLVLPTGYTGE